MHLILFLLLIQTSYAVELSFPPLESWQLRENFFGSRYALIQEKKGKASHVVLFKAMPQALDKSKVDEQLKRIIAAKVSSPQNPWIKPLVVKSEPLTNGGQLMEVIFEQKNLPHSALIGIYPDPKAYMFVFYSTQTLQFGEPRKLLVPYLKSLKAR
jgi:hypothetical protein